MTSSTGYELFSLTKILSINTSSKASTTQQQTEPQQKPSNITSFFSTLLQPNAQTANKPQITRDVTISCVAQGGFKGQEFFAVYCSNNFLIFRYVGESGVPLVRQIPWFKEPGLKIMAMSFNKSGQLCMCVTNDLTIVLIPIYFMMLKQSAFAEDEAMQSAQGFQFIRSASLKSDDKRRKVTDCIWWHSCSGHDYGIISSESGSLRFVNLSTQEVTRIKLKYPILKLSLVVSPSKDTTHLILTTGQSGGYWRLLIEQKRSKSANEYDIICSQYNTPAFQPQQLVNFSKPNMRLQAQMTAKGPILAVYHSDSNEYEIYDTRVQIYPMYRYKLFSANIQHIHLTDKLLLVFFLDYAQTLTVAVVSKLLTETKEKANQSFRTEAILQEFQLPGETPLGYFPGFEHPTTHKTEVTDQNSASVDTCTNIMNGFFIWTPHAIYEIRQITPLEEIFFKLVVAGKEKTKAESLGMTFGLDLLRMYEMAADHYFKKGNYSRALELYNLSNVSTEKLVKQFLKVGRVEAAITKLTNALHQPRDFTEAEKKRLSNQLLLCYVYRVLNTRTPNTNSTIDYDVEFDEFLRTNEDFDAHLALKLFTEYGMMYYYLVVAQARNLIPRALSLLLTERRSSFLSEPLILYLVDNNFGEQLKQLENGALISHLSPRRQLKLYLEDTATCHKYLTNIQKLLTLADNETLHHVCSFLDPLVHGSNIPPLELHEHPRKVPLDMSDPPGDVNHQLALRVFVAAMLILHSRQKNNNSSSSKEELSKASRGVRSVPISTVACGFNHSLAISEGDDAVYSFGHNTKSQLGHGSAELAQMVSPKLISGLSKVRIIQVACGGSHSVALDVNRTMWTWGDGSFGQLCQGDRNNRRSPVKVPNLTEPVLYVACGFFHTAAVIDGRLYTCGQGVGGQLGHGDTNDRVTLTLVDKLPTGMQVKMVKCGYSHTVILSERHEVFSVGNNYYGQLGLTHRKDHFTPQNVFSLHNKKVVDIDCGSFHTLARCENGQVYWWGRSVRPTRGSTRVIGKDVVNSDDSPTPCLVPYMQNKNVIKMAAGAYHNLFLLDNGDIYAWGGAIFNEYESRRIADDIDAPIHLTTLAKGKQGLRDMSCGESLCIIVTDEGNMYSMGLGQFGQLGTGNLHNQTSFAPVFIDIFKSKAQSAAQGSIYGDAEIIKATLRGHINEYDAKDMLMLCLAHKFYEGAAIICELLGAHTAALAHRIEHIKRNVPSDEWKRALIQQLDNTMKNVELGALRSDMMYLILETWKSLGLEVEELERYLMSNDDGLHLIGTILERNINSENPFGGLQFTPPFMLSVVERCFQRMNEDYRTTHADKVNEARLWSQVRTNLEKNLSKKTTIPISQVQLRDYIKHHPSGSQDVVFTCGHFFPKATFEKEILSLFREKVSSLPFPIPITLKLMLEDYAQPFINMACPACVFNYLRERQGQLQPVNVDKWTL